MICRARMHARHGPSGPVMASTMEKEKKVPHFQQHFSADGGGSMAPDPSGFGVSLVRILTREIDSRH